MLPPPDPLPLRAYIYTIPKAGTYLMDAFLSALGMRSTGWHVSLDHYLDTAGHELEVNAQQPSVAELPRPYLASIRRIPMGGHAFGHFNPMFVPTQVIKNLRLHVLAVRRHPREVLISEFVDFRFRRSDVAFVGAERYADPRDAFEAYMREHSPVIFHISIHYLLLRDLALNPHYQRLLGRNPVHFVDFRRFLSPDTGQGEAEAIARFFQSPLSREQVIRARQQALAAENKTRAVEMPLPLPREALWTPAAEAIYREQGFSELARSLGYSY